MKKSYKKLLLYEFILTFFFVINSFVSSILSKYNIILFLLINILVFKKFFGFEKDRHRYTKDIIIDIIIFILMYFLLFYLFGLVIGFAKTDNYYSWIGIKNYIIPAIATIVLKEILRYMILKKSEESKLLITTACIAFIFLDVTTTIYYTNFGIKYDSFLFFALYLLPAISSNIVFTYMSLKSGYRPIIFYLLIMEIYPFLVPIIPNANEYITSILHFMLPILLGWKVVRFFDKEKDRDIERDYHKADIVSLAFTLFFVIVLVYLTSGYFHYHMISIASGSMSPHIKKGDAVIIEKIENNYDDLKKGQVIAYKYNGVIVVHRLIRIIKVDDEYFYYTKGDANSKEDGYAIKRDMIIGVVNYKLPYIGYPTVWLNEL